MTRNSYVESAEASLKRVMQVGIAWLADIAMNDPKVFAAHRGQVGFTDFAERVRLKLDTPGDDSVHRHLRRIGEALGI